MENFDKILEEAALKIVGQEKKILDDFAKAYLAFQFSNGYDLRWCMENVQLNQQETWENGRIGYRWWFSIRETPIGRFKEFCDYQEKNKISAEQLKISNQITEAPKAVIVKKKYKSKYKDVTKQKRTYAKG